jgi:hypothetical protein
MMGLVAVPVIAIGAVPVMPETPLGVEAIHSNPPVQAELTERM